MTQEFIKTQCINCDKCIFERDGVHHFYPYPMPNDYIPMYCGSITEFGCHGIPLTDLESCPKKHHHDMKTQIPPLKQFAILQTENVRNKPLIRLASD